MEINKKTIIKINRKLGGNLSRNGSLDYALDRMKHEKTNPYKRIAYLVRAIIVDHPFVDGNKRTALEIIVDELYKSNIICDIEKLTKAITKIAKENTHQIIKIERRIRKCCQKK